MSLILPIAEMIFQNTFTCHLDILPLPLECFQIPLAGEEVKNNKRSDRDKKQKAHKIPDNGQKQGQADCSGEKMCCLVICLCSGWNGG